MLVRPMQQAVRDAPIGFMAATAEEAQAGAAKAAQRAGIKHAKANDGRAYLGSTGNAPEWRRKCCRPHLSPPAACPGQSRWHMPYLVSSTRRAGRPRATVARIRYDNTILLS